MSFSINKTDEPETEDESIERHEDGSVDWFAEALKRLDMNENDLEEGVRIKKEDLDGLVTDDDAAAILICKDRGIELVEEVKGVSDAESTIDIDNIVPGLQDVRCKVTVQDVQDLVDRDWGKVRSVMVSDSSGRTQVSFWDEDAEQADKLSYGDELYIKGAYTKDEMSDYMADRFGIPSIQIGDETSIEVNEDGNWVEFI